MLLWAGSAAPLVAVDTAAARETTTARGGERPRATVPRAEPRGDAGDEGDEPGVATHGGHVFQVQIQSRNLMRLEGEHGGYCCARAYNHFL